MSTVRLHPYLLFTGNAEEALNFYKKIFGGDLQITRFSDFPDMPVDENMKNLIMHAVLESESVHLMASDANPTGEVKSGDNFSISLSGDDELLLRRYFEGLASGGTITQPLETHPWGDTFGMLKDKFGTSWMINITTTKT